MVLMMRGARGQAVERWYRPGGGQAAPGHPRCETGHDGGRSREVPVAPHLSAHLPLQSQVDRRPMLFCGGPTLTDAAALEPTRGTIAHEPTAFFAAGTD